MDWLKDFCCQQDIEPEACTAVGDGATDIPVFEYCGKSIALNSSEKVKKVATHAVDTYDLFDVLPYLL